MRLSSFTKQYLFPLLFCGALIIYTVIVFALLPAIPKTCPDCETKNTHPTFMSFVYQSRIAPEQAEKLLAPIIRKPLKLKDKNVFLSITDSPKWPLTFSEQAPYNNIQNRMNDIPYHRLKVSYQLQNGKWVNYSESANHFYFIYILLFLGLLIVLGLIISNFVFVSLVSNSLKQARRSAKQLGLDLYTRIPVNKALPIARDTAQTMKAMQNRIQELVNHNSKMLAAISHDLRTPITRIKLRTATIEDPTTSTKISQDTEQIENMIAEVLNYTRNSAYKEKKQLIDINGMLKIVCYEFMDIGHQIQCIGLEQHVPMLIAENAMLRCFNNILSNAFKFGDQVIVTSKIKNKQLVITFEDNGPGIPDDELEKVLKPFYRTTYGKKASSTGAGLGLAIVSEVMHYHGGTVKLKNNHQSGLMVCIEFTK